jgi:hypothetical protein
MESMKAWGMTDQQIQGRNNTIDQQREYFFIYPLFNSIFCPHFRVVSSEN